MKGEINKFAVLFSFFLGCSLAAADTLCMRFHFFPELRPFVFIVVLLAGIIFLGLFYGVSESLSFISGMLLGKITGVALFLFGALEEHAAFFGMTAIIALVLVVIWRSTEAQR
ncbi:MAG: hypothetical protein ABIK46_05335 [candidate division WOR-3 bacterium]